VRINAKRVSTVALILLITLTAALFIGGHQPGSGKLFPPPWDKVVHLLFYGSTATLAGLAFPRLSILIIILGTIALGVADEIHQIFVPGRHPGFDDLIADAVGICIAALLIPMFRKRLLPPLQ